MDTNLYFTDIRLKLNPVTTGGAPYCIVKFADYTLYNNLLLESTEIKFQKELSQGKKNLEIYFNNKSDSDTTDEKDKAIIIEEIKINQFKSNKFIWLGVYEPDYPEPWYSQQIQSGCTPAKQLQNTTYMGWNGVFKLEIDIPAYTWIHRILSFGMIYPE